MKYETCSKKELIEQLESRDYFLKEYEEEIEKLAKNAKELEGLLEKRDSFVDTQHKEINNLYIQIDKKAVVVEALQDYIYTNWIKCDN